MASVTFGAALRHIHQLFCEGSVAGLTDAQLLERFIDRHDETAFGALVARHGPMVLGVCRGVIDDPHDVEDAFQAAFLILVRKARTIRGREALGTWLYRVAYRTALRANMDTSRRRTRERPGGELTDVPSKHGAPRQELLPALHEEIDRLPEKYRAPIVLCYLEEMSYEEAAYSLGWPLGTVGGRLARARELLRARLTRRGVTLAGGGVATLLVEQAKAAVPAGWVDSTVEAAARIAAGRAAGAMAALSLAERVLRTMLVSRLKVASAVLLAVGLAAASATGLATSGAAQAAGLAGGEDPPTNPSGLSSTAILPPPRGQDTSGAQDGEAMEFRGRVLGPDGQPKAGARLLLANRDPEAIAEFPTRATTGADGRFRFSVPKAEFDRLNGLATWQSAELVATADGCGPDWTPVQGEGKDDVTLRLVRDDVPIEGRVLDLQGRPVAGARIAVSRLQTARGEDLTAYIEDIRSGKDDGNGRRLEKWWWGPFPGRARSITTDPEGRFRLDGLGRERRVEITIEAPMIQSATVVAMTRTSGQIAGPNGQRPHLDDASAGIYGARFEHLVPPGRTINGVVRDKATGEPIAGVDLSGRGTNHRTTSGADGRFTLTGFPKASNYTVVALHNQGLPYFVTCAKIPDAPGVGPIEARVECVRGIPFRLRVTDNATGKPVKASVSYVMLNPNPHVLEVPGFGAINGVGAYGFAHEEADGLYVGAVMPGPGAVTVQARAGMYMPACVDVAAFFKAPPREAGREDFLYGSRDLLFEAVETPGGASAVNQENYSAIVLTNAEDGSGPLSFDVTVERSLNREVTVLGPDGEPLVGARASGVTFIGGTEGPLATAKFTVLGLNPKRTRRITVTHDEKKLVGMLMTRGDEDPPITVRLQPRATLTGRLVDARGRPRPGIRIDSKFYWRDTIDDPTQGQIPDGTTTDAEGRFRLEGLIPGLKYSARLAIEDGGIPFENIVLKPGEVRDLGDVGAKPTKREVSE
jgi:RNA polymerase sigma factor (sigma-70 family)